MKKRGFTLIEILAVIVILAVIALITIPIVTNVIEKSRIGAFKDSVLSAFHQVDYYLVENNLGEIPHEGIEVKSLNLKNNHFKYGTFYQKEELEVLNISDGKYCAIGTMNNLMVFKGECDLTTPRCNLSIVGEKGSKDWYFENPKVVMQTSEALTGGLKYGIGKEENYSKEISKGQIGKAEYQTTENETTKIYCYVKNIGDNKGSNSIEVKIDKTIPEEANFNYTTTSNSITVIANGKDSESGIAGYQFSKDNGATWTSIQTSNSYTFSNLKYEEYKIKIRVYNGTYVEKKGTNNLYKESEMKVVKPEELEIPTYQVSPTNWTKDPVKVTIQYTGSGVKLFKTTVNVTIDINAVKCSNVYNGTYTCEGETTKNIQAGIWYKVEENVVLSFGENGSVIAQVVDGVNYKGGSSLTINHIDKTEPTVSIGISNVKTDRATVTATCADEQSGIIKYEYSKDNGVTWVDGKTANSYIFTKLTKDKIYTYKVRCTNGSGLTKEASKKESTMGISNPTIQQTSQTPASGYTWATERVMEITYSETNIQNPVYYFKSSVAATVPSGTVTGSCGTGTNPGTCTTSNVTTLTANTWYKTTNTKPSITYQTNGILYAATSDGINLSTTANMTVSKVSIGTPTAPVIAGGDNNWTSGSRTIYVRTESTETSGILKYQYYISTSNSNLTGGSWKDCSTSTTSQTITTEGTRYIYFRAIGNNGKIGETSKTNTTKIDKTNPTVSVEVNGKVATFTIKDNIGAVGYGVNQSATEEPTYTTFTSTKETTKTYEGTTAGEYIVWVKDNAGRTAKATFTLAQIAFSYKATETTSTYGATYQQTGCTWVPCCPAASGCPSSCTRGSCPSHCVCNCNGTSANSTCYPTGTCQSCTGSAYTCPQGGTLSGTTCTKIEYSCPNGGTLNNTTHMCEF